MSVGDVQVGGSLHAHAGLSIEGETELKGALLGDFPLSFKSGPSESKTYLGVADPTGENVLVIPDAAGTLLTSSNMPQVLEGAEFSGASTFEGPVSMKAGLIVDSDEGIVMRSALLGASPITFAGKESDASLWVSDAGFDVNLALSDESGTILTTGSMSAVWSDLTVVGDFVARGQV